MKFLIIKKSFDYGMFSSAIDFVKFSSPKIKNEVKIYSATYIKTARTVLHYNVVERKSKN